MGPYSHHSTVIITQELTVELLLLCSAPNYPSEQPKE
jgi:hypothetical protein